MGAITGAVLAVGVVMLGSVIAGARLRGLLRAPVPPGLRVAVDLALGCWLLGSAYLLLGLLGALHPALLATPPLAAMVVGRWRGAGWKWELLAPASLGASLLLPLALAPPFFYDALVYHLALPWQALRDGRIGPHPETVFAAFPPLAQGVYLPLLALRVDLAPALVHLVLAKVAAGAAAVLARRLGAPRWAAATAGATLLLLPGHALVGGLPAAESFLLLPVVVALVLALAGGRGTAPLVGFLLGAAAAARLQALPWSVGIGALVLLRSRRRARDTTLAVAAWLLGSAPWWLKNTILLADPLAPLTWRRPGIETLWRDAGSALATRLQWSGVVPLLGNALTPLAAYLLPLALAAALAVAFDRRADRRWVAAAIVGSILAWLTSGSLPRFLLPSSALLLALAAAAARRFRVAGAMALAVAAILGAVFTVGELSRLGGPRLALSSREQVLRRLVVNDPFPAFALADALPTTSCTLFVAEPRGYGFPRRFVAPSQHDVNPLRPLLEGSEPVRAVTARLIAAGFTHLLVNDGELRRLAARYPVGPALSPRGGRRWAELLETLGPPLIRAGCVRLWVLRDGPGSV